MLAQNLSLKFHSQELYNDSRTLVQRGYRQTHSLKVVIKLRQLVSNSQSKIAIAPVPDKRR